MKKRLSYILLIVSTILMFSCENNNNQNIEELEAGEYLGGFTVKKESETTYTEEDTKFKIEINEDDNTLNLRMYQIKFDDKMPVRLNIIAKKIAYTLADGNGSAFIASVVPTVGGVPMEKYTLYDLDIEWDEDDLEVNFLCRDYSVNYNGKR